MGFPIRKFSDQSLFAAPRDLSQRTTSFIASQRQGIHQIPLRHLIALIANARRSAPPRGTSYDALQNFANSTRQSTDPPPCAGFGWRWTFEKTIASNASGSQRSSLGPRLRCSQGHDELQIRFLRNEPSSAPAPRPNAFPLHDVRYFRTNASLKKKRQRNSNSKGRSSSARKRSKSPAIKPSGGARRDRTDDLMLAKHALSQLSYGPILREKKNLASARRPSQLEDLRG